MVKAIDVWNVEEDRRRPNTTEMKNYILDGIEACTGYRNTDFSYDNSDSFKAQYVKEMNKTIEDNLFKSETQLNQLHAKLKETILNQVN